MEFIKNMNKKQLTILISSIAAAVVLIAGIVVAVVLLGGDNGGTPGGTNNPGTGGTGGVSSTEKYSYTVNLRTAGGMPMSDISVYIWSLVDGELDDIVDYRSTDANGSATFSLPKGGDYIAKIDTSVPDGYNAKSHYPLVGSKLDITLESSLLPADYIPGGTMELGDVMYDFTVTLTDGSRFTLSEALAEKDAVVINFWYDGCSACEAEFPVMNDVYFNYGDENGGSKYSEDIALVALSYIDTLDEVRSYKQYYGLDIDMAPDLGSVITSSFGVEYYPTTVVVDRYGVITLIEVGALTSERPWKIMFDHFRGDEYTQQLISSMSAITPLQKPSDFGYVMPPSEEIADVFETAGFDQELTYSNEESNEYSWPFLIGEYNNESVIYPSNKNIESSYSQLITTVTLKAGEALAFDYFTSTEQGADRLYVIVDKQDICSISGVGTEWETCYAYVAEADGEYQIVFCYLKDSTTNEGDDTVYMKNLRIVSADDIDAPTYIYRDAATDPDENNIYQNYVSIFLGSDGYYHVGSATGPLLLADLMGYTLFNPDDYIYNMCIDSVHEDALTEYCSYASNSEISGVVPVTPELKALLQLFMDDFGYQIGGDIYDENEWLLLCRYYDAYATGGEQLADPIKGLATFSAYETVLGGETYSETLGNVEAAFPNAVTYNRVIMPRGLLFKFTPTVSGTYKVTSHTDQEVNAWIFRAENVGERTEWLVYDNVTREIDPEDNNCYMIAYLEAGETYYIDIAYYDMYATGTVRFRVDHIGGEGYHRFTLASPGYFTYVESTTDVINKYIAGGLKVELGDDGYWHESRDDGRIGSILYVDFTMTTNIFTTMPIYNNGNNYTDLIGANAFNFTRTEDDQYVLNYIQKYYKDGTAGITREEAVTLAKAELLELWGDGYDGYSAAYGVDKICERFLEGNDEYYGTGADLTEEIRTYISKIIKAGDTIQVVNAAGDGYETVTVQEGDPMIGCVAVDARLAEILQLLMDKYTFAGVENSWTKLCYYRQYFCAATPK